MASKKLLKNFVYTSKTMTFNDLKRMVEGVADLNKKSKLNPSFSRKYIIENIFLPFFESLKDKGIDLDSIVNTTMLGKRDKLTLSVNGMVMLNILVECEYNP